MAEDRQAEGRIYGRGSSVRRRTAVVLAVFLALLIIFHRPILLAIGRQVALHYAARENLKANFRLEGNPFTSLTVRNFHAFPTGPTIIESVDVDYLHVDFSLWDLIHGRRAEVLKNVEVRSARVVIDPKKQSVKTIPPRAGKRVTLPGIFPNRVRLEDVNLIVRDSPHDLVLEHVDLELDPRAPGYLRMAKLQLPAARAWTNISGETSYANKNLIISKLALTDGDEIRVLNVDASHLSANEMSVNFDLVVGGGIIIGATTMREAASSIEAKTRLTAEQVDLAALNKYIGTPDGTLRGVVSAARLEGSGLFNVPQSWKARATGQIDNFHWDAASFDHASLEAVASDGVATLTAAEFAVGANKLNIHGTVALPASSKQLGRDGVSLEITGSGLELANLTAGSQKPLAGTVDINGRIEIKNARLDAAFTLAAASIRFADGGIDKLTANIRATKTLPPPDTKQAWFVDLHSVADVLADNVRIGDYQFDSVQGQIVGNGNNVQFSNLVGRRNQNEVNIRGDYVLPENFRQLASQPAHLNVSLNAAELGDFWAGNSAWKMTGPLKVTGEITWKNNVANGQLSILGTSVRMRELVFHQLSGEVSIVNNVVTIKDFTARLSERDFVSANGTFSLDPPYQYSGKVAANLPDLTTLQPLLHASGNENQLAGSLVFEWEGNGNAQTFKNSGKLKLVLEKGRYGNLQSVRANIDASYSPEGLDIPIIFFATNNMDFQAIAQAKGETLEISKIQLDQGRAKFASGYISIPFVWGNLGTSAPVVPSSGKVTATFQSDNLDIRKVFEDIGVKPMASGTLNAKLEAKGTITDLNARLDVQMRDLRSEEWPHLEPATFDATAEVVHSRLAIAGKLQQTRIQPLELTANMPFDVPKIVRAGELPDETPITAKARLPRSPVNFIRQFLPALEQLDGEVGFDVDVSGTIGNPVLSGAGDVQINVARFTNATLPALHNLNARLNFAGNALTLEGFNGNLAGGPFAMSGRVTFPRLTEPTVDLQLKAESVLIARNDTLTARADADLKVTGPFLTATVTGSVALTNSHFLKNIDLIPIGLPGRPAPEPPSSRPEYSLPDPPFRNWKFDVAVKTKDPVLIRGNLATGSAIVDLKLTGTGLHPELQGLVRMKNVEATLPFSRLDVSYGFLYFDPRDSFNPRIDLQGTSVIRDYTVRVYVYGTLLEPQTIFTSEPPLPQEEIISLIATGATRAELSGNNNVLAGRAAMLLVQQLYRKIFKKGEPIQSNTVFNRLDLDVGTIDPRTGRQQITARFKIDDHFVLVGDVGVGGNYRGMLKYLIRFR